MQLVFAGVIDHALDINNVFLEADAEQQFRPPPLLRAMVRAGKLPASAATERDRGEKIRRRDSGRRLRKSEELAQAEEARQAPASGLTRLVSRSVVGWRLGRESVKTESRWRAPHRRD